MPALRKHKREAETPGKKKKTTIHTIISSSKLPTIASQWTPLLPCYQSSSLATSQKSSLLSLISLLTLSKSTWLTSMQSVELSNNVYRTLMESCCCAPMDMRIIMEDSPYLLSLVQMGTILLSSSSNWTMEEWQDLAP